MQVSLAAIHRGGVGMYPDETCYDRTRPGWLPNWLDDFEETACKANELIYGNKTGNTAQPGTTGAAPETIANAQAQCASNGGTWNTNLGVCQPSFLSQYGIYIAGAAIGLGLIMFAMRK